MSTIAEKSPAPATRRVEYVTPRVNLHQDAEGYSLEVEMPGVGKDGVEITAGDGKLVIVGHRNAAETAGKAIYRERNTHGYRRVFDLDPSIDTGSISAHVEQGLLTVHLRKSESAKPRKITVS
jgi:HSP20 family protein